MTPVRILLIEDTMEDARLIQEALVAEQGSAAAFQLTHAIALEPGLRHLANNETDVVLLDLNLPDSVGLGSVVRVRERSPGVPILVLTASDDTAIAVEAVKRGAEDYLVKGHVQVYPNLLSRAIRYALERQRVEVERERLQGQLLQSQKMEIIGRFAGGIAHDFNNFLQAILGFAWLIRARFQKSPELMADLQEIVHAAESASEMVHQLLAFSRRKPLQPKVLDMNAAVRGMARLLQQFAGPSIRVDVELSSEPLAVKCDPTGLEQILMNLCANARDSMPQGGTLTVSTRRVEADAAFRDIHPAAKAGVYAGLSVRDTGTGMEPAVAAHVFEPFFTTKQTGKGTGLGLAVVYGLVQQHEGLVHIETAPGQGTTFHLFFPHRELQSEEAAALQAAGDAPPPAAEPAAAPPPAAAGTGRTAKPRVLVVDDDPAIRRLCERILAPTYEVLVLPSGRAALDELERTRYHLLLTDLRMPNMDGVTLLKEVAQLAHAPHVLAMTGSVTRDMEQRLQTVPLSGPVIHKPFTAPALLEEVGRCLGQALRAG